jgi:hypothetical protein
MSSEDTIFKQIHPTYNYLKFKFGEDKKIISIKRDDKERWISNWKQLLKQFINNKEMFGYKSFENYKILQSLTPKDILTYNIDGFEHEYSQEKLRDFIKNEYINTFGLKNINEFKNNKDLFDIICGNLEAIIRPQLYYHQDASDIIWFDFNNLKELEKWVSNELNKKFNLIHRNHSIAIECNVQNDEDFKYHYDKVYSKNKLI